jgi:hypothetical protein
LDLLLDCPPPVSHLPNLKRGFLYRFSERWDRIEKDEEEDQRPHG